MHGFVALQNDKKYRERNEKAQSKTQPRLLSA